MYAVFNGKEECVARGNARTLDQAKILAERPKPEPLLRTVIETNGTTIIRHVKKPGSGWVQQAQKGRSFEKFERPQESTLDGKNVLLFKKGEPATNPVNVNTALGSASGLGDDELPTVTKDNV